ncbi:hypothetical protein WN944_006102 [Citrus x changshan-huyou]|uniref:Uncharacterized protein n=1 Tax=Citrus x changshan-huyou TaxID=2935761 RepID=A0AAP0MIL5_9ROSI
MILELLLFHIMFLLSSPPNYVVATPSPLLAASYSSSTFSNRAYCYYDEVWSSLEDFQHEDEVIVNRYVGLQKPNFVFSRTRDFCRIASNSLAFMACNPTDFIIRGGWCQLPASLDGFMFAIENPQDGEGLNLIKSRDFQDAEGIIKLDLGFSHKLRWYNTSFFLEDFGNSFFLEDFTNSFFLEDFTNHRGRSSSPGSQESPASSSYGRLILIGKPNESW